MTRRLLLLVGLLLLAAAAYVGAAWWFLFRIEERELEPDWIAQVTTIGGDGVQGHRDGRRTAARFEDPFGIAVAPDGAAFVADRHSIRRIAPDGEVRTVAGGDRGFRDGPAGAARFDTISGIALGSDGTLYVADTGNDAIRRVGPEGSVSTIAARDTGLNGPIGIALDAGGRLLVADTYNDRIVAIRPDGTQVTLAGTGEPGLQDGPADSASFDTPCGIAVDASGNIYVADLGNGAVRVISPDGVVRTIAPGYGEPPLRPVDIAVAPDGVLVVADDRGRIIEYRPEGGSRTVAGSRSGYADGPGEAARFRNPSGIAAVGPGSLLVTDRRNALVRRVIARSLMNGDPPAPPIRPRFDSGRFGLRPLLWPFEPLEGPFEVTGTLGEPRGGAGAERFHAGLDVYAPENTPVLVVRAETVEHPSPESGIGTINESVRLEAVTYIHLRIGRDRFERPMPDPRFVFSLDERGRVTRVRVKRGARFEAGEVIGTVNRFYHSHLNIGWPGEERNPLLFRLVNFEDTVPPVIVRGGVQFVSADGTPVKARDRGRWVLDGAVRIVVDAWDQVDGNLPRRRLGLYRLGYVLLHPDGSAVPAFGPLRETLRFDGHLADQEAARAVYADGSGIPVYGSRRTRFLYRVTSRLQDGVGEDGVFDTTGIPPGDYTLRILAADFNGNEAVANRDVPVTIRQAER